MMDTNKTKAHLTKINSETDFIRANIFKIDLMRINLVEKQLSEVI